MPRLLTPDPTPAEIAGACERIQRTWSDAERRRRRWGLMPGSHCAAGSGQDVGWMPPTIHVTAVDAAQLTATR